MACTQPFMHARLVAYAPARLPACASTHACMQIMADCSLDDGDIARLLIRTADLLKQVAYNAHLVPELRESATQALQGMDRKPIADLVSI